MSELPKSFSTNRNMMIAPIIFFGGGLIVLNSHPDFILGYALPFSLGILFTLALLLQIRTYTISEGQIHVKGLFKEVDIKVKDISHYKRKTSFYKGNEMITWKLHLNDHSTVTILTDYIKEASRFKEALNWELRDVKMEK